MSCDWKIYCRDCDTAHYFNDANHQVDLMRSLIRHAPAIAAMAPVIEESGIEVVTMWGRINPEWFARHLGHDLVPQDEYGKCDDDCGRAFRCSEGEPHTCLRENGHPPSCLTKREQASQ